MRATRPNSAPGRYAAHVPAVIKEGKHRINGMRLQWSGVVRRDADG